MSRRDVGKTVIQASALNVTVQMDEQAFAGALAVHAPRTNSTWVCVVVCRRTITMAVREVVGECQSDSGMPIAEGAAEVPLSVGCVA